MNKKQAGIIVTLLVLIVCAGILAAKVNGPLEVSSDFSNGSDVFNFSKDNKTENKTDFFVTSQLEREQNEGKVLASYQVTMDNKNLSQAIRDEAAKKHMAKTAAIDQEGKIETSLKAQGFEDAICLIEDNKARIIVKAKDVNEQQRKKIQDVVKNIAKITEVEIQAKE